MTSSSGEEGIDMLILTCAVLIRLITTNRKPAELPSDLRYPRRVGRRSRPFLQNLPAPQTFIEWLHQTLRDQVAIAREVVHPDIVFLSQLPVWWSTAYRSMYAYGNHLRMANVESHLQSCNLGIAATFHCPCCSRL